MNCIEYKLLTSIYIYTGNVYKYHHTYHQLLHEFQFLLQVAILKTLTLDDLKDWYKQYLGENQRRISFQVIRSHGHDIRFRT